MAKNETKVNKLAMAHERPADVSASLAKNAKYVARDKASGITRFSLEFFDENADTFDDFVHAWFVYDKEKADYELHLEDKNGDEMILEGCSFGYGGEGSHGTMEVLQKAGFPITSYLAEIVFGHAPTPTRGEVRLASAQEDLAEKMEKYENKEAMGMGKRQIGDNELQAAIKRGVRKALGQDEGVPTECPHCGNDLTGQSGEIGLDVILKIRASYAADLDVEENILIIQGSDEQWIDNDLEYVACHNCQEELKELFGTDGYEIA